MDETKIYEKVCITMPNLKIKCNVCGDEFIFTEGEQKFFAERNFKQPKKCQKCRSERKDNISDVNNFCKDIVVKMLSDLGFEEGKNFAIEVKNVDNKNVIIVNCLDNIISRALLYNKGEEAGAIRTHIKNCARKNNTMINIDIKKFE